MLGRTVFSFIALAFVVLIPQLKAQSQCEPVSYQIDQPVLACSQFVAQPVVSSHPLRAVAARTSRRIVSISQYQMSSRQARRAQASIAQNRARRARSLARLRTC